MTVDTSHHTHTPTTVAEAMNHYIARKSLTLYLFNQTLANASFKQLVSRVSVV